MLKNTVALLAFIFLFSACSTHNKSSESQFATVDLHLDIENDESPILNTKNQVGRYGPTTDQNNANISKKDRKVLGLFLGPSLYKSIDSIDVLKCFEKLDKKVNIISGTGFSSIVAGLYAQGDSPETIKWKIFKTLRKSKGTKPYSEEWINVWSQFIEKNISLRSLKKSEKSLWMPKFDNGASEVIYSSKGDLLSSIKENININEASFPMKKNFLYKSSLDSMPVDRLIVINTIPDDFTLKQSDGLLLGMYGKIISKFKKITNNKVLVINVKTDGPLDSERIISRKRNIVPFCNQLEEVL